jgi:hypothetical protein
MSDVAGYGSACFDRTAAWQVPDEYTESGTRGHQTPFDIAVAFFGDETVAHPWWASSS